MRKDGKGKQSTYSTEYQTDYFLGVWMEGLNQEQVSKIKKNKKILWMSQRLRHGQRDLKQHCEQ